MPRTAFDYLYFGFYSCALELSDRAWLYRSSMEDFSGFNNHPPQVPSGMSTSEHEGNLTNNMYRFNTCLTQSAANPRFLGAHAGEVLPQRLCRGLGPGCQACYNVRYHFLQRLSQNKVYERQPLIDPFSIIDGLSTSSPLPCPSSWSFCS